MPLIRATARHRGFRMDKTRVLAPDLYAGQAVFTTGGGSGINFGIAQCFARLGANIAICGRIRAKLEPAATELEGWVPVSLRRQQTSAISTP